MHYFNVFLKLRLLSSIDIIKTCVDIWKVLHMGSVFSCIAAFLYFMVLKSGRMLENVWCL